jgi:hypothetical protein
VQPASAAAAARLYTGMGLCVLPLQLRAKGCFAKGWEQWRITGEDLERHFPAGQEGNIGVLLGAASGGLVDLDLDCMEAVRIAPYMIPAVTWVFGHAPSAPHSHRIYRCTEWGESEVFNDVDGTRLLELRTDKPGQKQTVFPPSRHKETGELITWSRFDGHSPPATVGWSDLRQAVRKLAAAVLIARHWPAEGSRDAAAMALHGALCRAGWGVEQVNAFVDHVAVAATDPERRMRAEKGERTSQRLQEGRAVTGWPTLEALLTDGQRVGPRVREWLDCQPAPESVTWEEPIPFRDYPVPDLPLDTLPGFLVQSVSAVAESTQTPPDLAAMLMISVCGAGLAKRFRVAVREGWSEPLNVFAVVALPPGERKSAVFDWVMAPVRAFEQQELARTAPLIAEEATKHRILEARLKGIESKAAKVNGPEAAHDRDAPNDEPGREAKDGGESGAAKPGGAEGRRPLEEEAKEVAKALAAHQVPEPPQFFCDDVTPEKLGNLLARHGGCMLLASAEGTPFEIAKGRYTDKAANFEVYLKGHSGDDLRVGRISRSAETVPQPALSAALAVQPDVIQGLADQTSLRGRGFLARWLYSIPRSLVGRRKIAARPVPAAVATKYQDTVVALWKLLRSEHDPGKSEPQLLQFSAAADKAMQAFEAELEPRLGRDGDLGHLSSWGNKLAGAAARLAGIFHVAEAIAEGNSWRCPVSESTANAAIRLGREYLVPQALAAFGLMGADARTERAKRLLAWIRRTGNTQGKPLHRFSRRDAHRALGRHIDKVDELEPVLELLAKHHFIRPMPMPRQAGPGQKASQVYDVNPKLWNGADGRDPVDTADRIDGKGGESVAPAQSVNSVSGVDGNTPPQLTEVGVSLPSAVDPPSDNTARERAAAAVEVASATCADNSEGTSAPSPRTDQPVAANEETPGVPPENGPPASAATSDAGSQTSDDDWEDF